MPVVGFGATAVTIENGDGPKTVDAIARRSPKRPSQALATGSRTNAGSTPKTSRTRSGASTSQGRAVGDESAAVEKHEAREEVRGKREVVEDRDDRRPVAVVEIDQELHRLDLVAEVQVHGRLVEEEDRRLLRDGERDQDELTLAERQLARVTAEEMADPDPFDRARDRRPVGGPEAAERILVREAAEGDDVLDAHREGQARRTRHHREASGDPARSRVSTGRFPSRTRPSVGRDRPVTAASSVDLPAPLGPISATRSPASIDRSRRARAIRSRYATVTWSRARIGSVIPRTPRACRRRAGRTAHRGPR